MKLKDKITSNGKYLARKYIFEKENKTVEFTYIDRTNKNIICVSSMFGCPIGCKFCASGLSYLGKLAKEDMIRGIEKIIEIEKLPDNKKLLISFMGSGEPLLNVKQINKVIDFFKINPYTSFALSTSGKNIEKINQFNYQNKLKIQFSLHHPNNLERKKLIPLTEDLDKIFKFLYNVDCDLEINYILLEGINDSDSNAKELSKLMEKFNSILKINEYHEINNIFKESSRKKTFFKILNKNNIDFEWYATDAVDIQGACGQLVSKIIK